MPSILQASEYVENGFHYTVTTSMINHKKIASIQKYEGNATTLHFPDNLGGYPVTSVDEGSFSGNTSLVNVIFPNSFLEAGGWSFQNCVSLINITVPSKLDSIHEVAFENCTSLTMVSVAQSNSDSSLTSYAPSIYYAAFRNCKSLSSMTIPDKIVYISSAAFYGCTSLTRIIIPNKVKTIEGLAFSHCTSLTQVTIPNSVTKIDKEAFSNCSAKLTIYCNKGSVAQKYATRNKIRWSAGFPGGIIRLTFHAT